MEKKTITFMNKLAIASFFLAVNIFGNTQNVFAGRDSSVSPSYKQVGDALVLSEDEKHVLKMLSPLYQKIFLYALDSHQREIVVIYEKRGKSPFGAIDAIVHNDRKKSDKAYYRYRSKAQVHYGRHEKNAYKEQQRRSTYHQQVPVQCDPETQDCADQSVYTKSDVVITKKKKSNRIKRTQKYKKSPEFLEEEKGGNAKQMTKGNRAMQKIEQEKNLHQSTAKEEQYDSEMDSYDESQTAYKEEKIEKVSQTTEDSCDSCKSLYCDRVNKYEKKQQSPCLRKSKQCQKKRECSCCKSRYCQDKDSDAKQSLVRKCKKYMSKKSYKQVGSHKKFTQPKNGCVKCINNKRCR